MSELGDRLKQTKEDTARSLARLLATSVNSSTFDVASFVDELVLHEHRTLQQNVFGLFLDLLRGWDKAKQYENYDARNEWTVNKASSILSHLGPYAAPPFI